MSAPSPSFEGLSASFCQRCQSPLPPNIIQCGYCGYDNVPVQLFSPASSRLPEFISPPQTPEVSPFVTTERRTLNMKKVVGLIIMLFVIIGGSVASYAMLVLQQRVMHTTSVLPGYPIPKGPPLFTETFMNNNKQWDMGGMPGRYLVSIKKRSLMLEDDDNKLFPILVPSAKHFDNFKLIVNAKLSKGDRQNGYGLCIRGTTDPNGYLTAYYRIELYGNAAYTIFKAVTDINGNTSSTTLVNTTAHAAILPEGHLNQMVVIADGPKMTLIVNGQTVQTFSDTYYASGVVALFVSNLPGTHPGAQATFSDLAIYPVKAK